MKYNPLGRSGIQVSEICLGTMTWGSQNSEAEAHEQLDYAVGEGVNFFDTAEMYPTTPRKAETNGRTEEFLGSWLKGRSDRDKLIVATKVTGQGVSDLRGGVKVDSGQIRVAIEGSLQRLKTDCIDLYQLHWPNRGSYHFRKYWHYDPTSQDPGDIDAEITDILGEVQRLQGEGKLREFGLSNESAWGTMKFLQVAEKQGLPRVVSMQNEYSLLCRIYDLDMAEVSVREDVGLLAYSPLAAGALSGKYRDGQLPEGSRKSMQDTLNGRFTKHAQAAIDRYAEIAGDYGLDLTQLSLAFCLTRSFMTSVIIGATSMEQLRTNIGASEVTLSDDVLGAIQSVYQDLPLPM